MRFSPQAKTHRQTSPHRQQKIVRPIMKTHMQKHMKKHWAMITTTVVIGSVLPINGTPAIAQVFSASTAIAQNILQQPQVTLNLRAEQEVIQKTTDGKVTQTWVATDDKVKVKSGDRLRFTVTGKNTGNRAAQSFAVTQPVPNGTKLVLNSAQSSRPAQLTYSLDQAKTFTPKPMVKVTLADGRIVEQAAPAEAYTHVRWNFGTALAPTGSLDASYQVAVR
jgi:uncharacterized repeat protein (TIGR01451 family)